MAYGMFMAHSGWRYLILLLGVAVVVYALYGTVTKKDYDKPMQTLASLFAVSMHIQVLLGLAVIMTGQFNPNSGLHIVTMIFAAVVAQIPSSVMRRRPENEKSFGPHAVFGAVAMVLIVLGIVSLGVPIVGS